MVAVKKTNGSICHVIVPSVLFDKTPVLLSGVKMS